MLAHDLVADGTLKMPALFQIVTGIKYGLAGAGCGSPVPYGSSGELAWPFWSFDI
jgi:hypothetical protein